MDTPFLISKWADWLSNSKRFQFYGHILAYLIGKNLVGKKISRKKILVGKNFGHFAKFGHFLPGGTFDPIVFRGLIRKKN